MSTTKTQDTELQTGAWMVELRWIAGYPDWCERYASFYHEKWKYPIIKSIWVLDSHSDEFLSTLRNRYGVRTVPKGCGYGGKGVLHEIEIGDKQFRPCQTLPTLEQELERFEREFLRCSNK